MTVPRSPELWPAPLSASDGTGVADTARYSAPSRVLPGQRGSTTVGTASQDRGQSAVGVRRWAVSSGSSRPAMMQCGSSPRPVREWSSDLGVRLEKPRNDEERAMVPEQMVHILVHSWIILVGTGPARAPGPCDVLGPPPPIPPFKRDKRKGTASQMCHCREGSTLG